MDNENKTADITNLSVENNLRKLHDKIDQLEEVRDLIMGEIDSTGQDMRKKMFFTEMLKNLLDVDKTILSFLKESSSIQQKGADNQSRDLGNALLRTLVQHPLTDKKNP